MCLYKKFKLIVDKIKIFFNQYLLYGMINRIVYND